MMKLSTNAPRRDNRFILTLSCEDRKGIVAAVSHFLLEQGGFVVESAQLGDQTTNRFFMRTVFDIVDGMKSLDKLREHFAPIAQDFAMECEFHAFRSKAKAVIMVSKQGHCLNDILHRQASGLLDIDVTAVISNHPDLEKMATWYEIPFYHFPVSAESKPEQEEKVLEVFQKSEAELLVLARYMQILSPWIVGQIYGKAINIHHSFLPGFKGARPYHQAFDRGVKIIGATAHYVSNELDEGPIIEQEVIRVDHAYSPRQFEALGRDIESLVLSRALQYHCERRVIINANKTVVFR